MIKAELPHQRHRLRDLLALRRSTPSSVAMVAPYEVAPTSPIDEVLPIVRARFGDLAERMLPESNPVAEITTQTFKPRLLHGRDIRSRDGIAITTGGTLTSITFEDGSQAFLATNNPLNEEDRSIEAERTTTYHYDGEIMTELYPSGETAFRNIGENASPSKFLPFVERRLGHPISGGYRKFVAA
jgi:hypothetical protein